jgi:hypothetical protein
LKDATSFFEIVDIAFVQLSLIHQLHSQLILSETAAPTHGSKRFFPILELALRLCIRTPLRADITLFLYSSFSLGIYSITIVLD